jgi:4-hydroxy-tetrahydrodipicolinate synthase
MKDMGLFKGTGVALVTPFKADMSVDFEALRRLVQLQLQGGTNFLVVMGTTAESPTLSNDEKEAVLDVVIEENNGKLPIVFGVGGNNTTELVKKLHVLPKGVDAILSVSPYYNKPTQDGIYQHFIAVADASPVPVILYNVPGRTGSNMLPSTILRLAEHENIVAVKEASGNFDQIMEIISKAPQGFDVLSGDDALTMPLIACGARGVISVVANALPEKFSNMINLSIDGDFTSARLIHNTLLSITKMFFEEGNPGGVKVALENRGIMEQNLRLPLVKVSSSLSERINQEMKTLLELV